MYLASFWCISEISYFVDQVIKEQQPQELSEQVNNPLIFNGAPEGSLENFIISYQDIKNQIQIWNIQMNVIGNQHGFLTSQLCFSKPHETIQEILPTLSHASIPRNS